MAQRSFPFADREGDDAGSATVLHLPLAQIRALADASRSGGAPEVGRRTPQPTITRYQSSRHRFYDLDLDTVQVILRQAEDGNTQELADLWVRMLKIDAHLRSVWTSRLAPVFSARWEISPPADTPEALASVADAAARACEEALRGVPGFTRVIGTLLDAIGLGFSVVEIEWARGTLLGRPAWVPRRLHPVHSRRFGFSDHFEIGLWDNGTAVPMLEADGFEVDAIASRGRNLARLPAGKYVVHQPVEIHDYPTSTGLVHALVRWWWAKQVATKYWLQGAEQFANPRFIGHVGQDAPGAQVVEELHEGLENLAADGVVVTRGDTRIDVLDPKGEGATATWESLFTRLDAAMSKAVLGSTLNVEIGEAGGNRAAAESQADQTIRPRLEQDAEQVWTTLRRDLLSYVVRYNPHLFPAGTPVPEGRSILAEEPVEIDQVMIGSGWVKVDELRESRGLPPLGGDVGESFVKPPQAPAAFTASDAPEVAPPVPFAASERLRPWDLARALTSTAVTATSTRSPTT